MKTIGLILSYNNPIMTDRLYDNIREKFETEIQLIVLDNGSDKDKISKYTTHYIDENCRMTRGFNCGIDIINKEIPDFDNIWFFTNDCYFEQSEKCPLKSSEYFLSKYPDIGILHPSESKSVNVCYDVHNDHIVNGVKIVVEYDIVCPIFTKKAIESIGGKFNERLYQGWGIDHESSYLVRKNSMLVGINHQIIIGHDTSSTYDNGLDKLHPNRNSYYNAAMNEMYTVFNDMYTNNWHSIFTNNYTQNKNIILE